MNQPHYHLAVRLWQKHALAGLVVLGLLLCGGPGFAGGYQIGVYYFPGWKDGQLGAPSPQPWEAIKAFPARKPLLGWYEEGSDAVMRQQLAWMRAYGIDYVVFDSYFGIEGKAYLEHALQAYLRAPRHERIKFSILWANHAKVPRNFEHWEAMIRYWAKHYFSQPDFLQLDGKPVVFVFSAGALKKQAGTFGATSRDLLDKAQAIAQEAGFTGIHFVAGTGANEPMITYAQAAGYESFSAYNYHQGPGDTFQSHSYSELDQGYRKHWQHFAAKGNLPLIVPMTSGWDKRPWGGSKDPWHDNSLSTPKEFRKHLEAAKAFMDDHPILTRKMGVICCWNEYGEGSFIEPAEKLGFDYLEQVKKTFGKSWQ